MFIKWIYACAFLLAGEAIAAPFAKELPDYTLYAETTKDIEKNRLQEALKRSYALKEKMDQENTSAEEPFLYALNCLRIAFLEGKVGTKEKEEAAWALFKKTEKSGLLQKHVRIEGATLGDYISSRIKVQSL